MIFIKLIHSCHQCQDQLVELWFVSILGFLCINVHVQVFVWTYVFVFLSTYIPRRIAWPMVMLCLTFWRTAQLFQNGYTLLHSPHPCMRIPVSQIFTHTFLFSFFSIVAILDSVKWCCILVWICIFLMAKAIEYLLMCVSSVEKYLNKSLFHLFIGLSFYCWVIVVLGIVYILDLYWV